MKYSSTLVGTSTYYSTGEKDHSPSEESSVSEGFSPSVLEGGVRTNREQRTELS